MKRSPIIFLILFACLATAGRCDQGSSAMERIQKDRALLVASVPFSAPYFHQAGEGVAGPDAELGRRITRRLGGEIQTVFAPRTFSTLVSAVADGETVLAISALGVTESRKAQIAFSVPYHELEISLIINPNHKPLESPTHPGQLEGLNIGVREGSSIQEYAAQAFPDSSLVPLNTLDSAVLALRRGEVDVVLDDRLMAAVSLSEVTGASHLELLPDILTQIPIAVGLPLGETELLALVNEVVSESSAEYAEWLRLSLGDRLEEVSRRYVSRMQKAARARAPREVTIRISKEADSELDIYVMANLSFEMVGDGRTYRSSPVEFRGAVGYATVRVPPGDYALAMRRVGFDFPVTISTDHPDNVTVNIRLTRGGVQVSVG